MELLELLKKANVKIAVAESLTAGKVQDIIAKESGVSAYFQGGITTYTCEMKNKLLGVNSKLLEEKGPYNLETTEQMCEGVRKMFNADVVLATSGVAGPNDDGDTKAGTVYITVFDGKYKYHSAIHFDGTREEVRCQATEFAINILKQYLVSRYDCLREYVDKLERKF